MRKMKVLLEMKEERNILQSKKEGRLTGLVTSCLITAVKSVIERKMEARIDVTRGQGRRRMQLLDDINPLNAELNPICHSLSLLRAHHILHVSRIRVKEKRGCWILKEEAVDRKHGGNRF